MLGSKSHLCNISALLGFAWNGNVGEVEGLLSTLDPNTVETGRSHNTAMHFAAKKNHPAVIQTLLAHPGIDPNVKNEDDETPYGFNIHRDHSQ